MGVCTRKCNVFSDASAGLRKQASRNGYLECHPDANHAHICTGGPDAVLLIVSSASIKLLKILCVFFLLGNSLALYFMNSYNVILDRAMMGNVFSTDTRETRELIDITLLWYLVVATVLPTIAIYKTNVQATAWRRKISTLAAVLYANSSTWLWLDKHAKHIGAMMLPWSYVVNSIRHFDQIATKDRPRILLPPAYFSEEGSSKIKSVVVLVIGEAARAKNFSLYGYGRTTNPYTASSSMVAMPGARACSTYTTQSLACMLSHEGGAASVRTSHEPLPSYLQRHGVDVAWRSNNWGEPPLSISSYERPADIQKTCIGNGCSGIGFDGILLNGLKERIASSTSSKVFVVLHLNGSHGPAYHTKYPPEFEHFKPVCKSVELRKCTNEELVNAYDNTLVYTDHILQRVVDTLEAFTDSSSTMIYVSDHGESLGEYGLFLHGAPSAVAPDVQTTIPILVWMSKKFQSDRGLTPEVVSRRPAHTHDYVFHSVMGAFGLRSDIYKPNFDVFNK
jgi:lipid A ethanolaminephosphotransferase